MITPTVGRIVWFRPASSSPDHQPLAAIVTHVISNRMVNLAVFTEDGMASIGCTRVPLLQDEEPGPMWEDYCEWMPYQKRAASGEIPPTLHAQPKV